MLVLVIDDDAQVRQYVTMVLLAEGYAVAQAVHGEAALSYLATGLEPDLILLDVVTPIMDGNDFLVKLQTVPRRPPVIVMTGYLHALKHPELCHEVMEKPLAAAKLREMIAKAARGVTNGGQPGPDSGPSEQP